MNYDCLGASPTDTAPVFVRLIAPTDIQKVACDMAPIITANHSMDFINPTVWRLVGLDGGPTIEFLKRYIYLSRAWGIPVTDDNLDRFKAELVSRHDYRESDLDEYFDAFLTLVTSNMVPDDIYRPYTAEVDESYGEEVAGKIGKKVFWWGLLAVGIYGASKTVFPSIGKFIGGSK